MKVGNIECHLPYGTVVQVVHGKDFLAYCYQ
jgi:hypothetical protein